MNFWKKLPYWLKGGVIGGGIALACYLLMNSCFLLSSIGLKAGEVGFSYYCSAFYILGPAYPTAWLINLFEPILHYSWTSAEVYAPVLSIPLWFILGSFIRILVGYIKSKKK